MIKFLAIILLVILDQISKYAAVANLKTINATHPFIEGLLQFRYIHNTGASFGILQGKQTFLIIVTTITLLLLLVVIYRNIFKSTTEQIALILIAAGGIGNLIDRVINGYVVDFLDFQFIDFPVFNVADSFVCIGFSLFILYYIIEEIKNKKLKKNKENNNENV